MSTTTTTPTTPGLLQLWLLLMMLMIAWVVMGMVPGPRPRGRQAPGLGSNAEDASLVSSDSHNHPIVGLPCCRGLVAHVPTAPTVTTVPTDVKALWKLKPQGGRVLEAGVCAGGSPALLPTSQAPARRSRGALRKVGPCGLLGGTRVGSLRQAAQPNHSLGGQALQALLKVRIQFTLSQLGPESHYFSGRLKLLLYSGQGCVLHVPCLRLSIQPQQALPLSLYSDHR